MNKCVRCHTNEADAHGICAACIGKCQKCGAAHEGDSARCDKCNAFSMRLCRLLKDKDADFCDNWNGFSQDLTTDKAAFYAKANRLVGDALDKLLTETLEEHVSQSNEITFTGTGNFLDEDDIRTMYKDKPERLEAIRKHATRFVCPTTGTEFIENMAYKREVKDSQKRVESRSTKAATERTVKKAKVVREPKVDLNVNPKTLSDAQKATLQKYIDAAPKHLADLQGIKEAVEKEEAQAWKGLLPAYVMPSIEAMYAKVDEHTTMFAMYIEHGEGDMKTATTGWKLVIADVKERIRSAKVQIIEAKKMQQQ